VHEAKKVSGYPFQVFMPDAQEYDPENQGQEAFGGLKDSDSA
jgi:hypothetical protein